MLGLLRWLSGKESNCQCRRSKICKFHPWVRKIPWSRKWQPTSVFLPGKSQGQSISAERQSLGSHSRTQLSTTHPLPNSLCYNFVSYHDNAFYWLFPFNVRTNPGSVQFSSFTQSCLILCNPMNCSMPGLPVHHQLPEATQMHVHWVGDAIQPSHPHHPLLLLPSIFPRIRVFSNESALHIRWPKYWSFSFSISLSNEHSGLISFRMDWLDLLAVQGTLKSLSQHHSSKHQFFCIQLSL